MPQSRGRESWGTAGTGEPKAAGTEVQVLNRHSIPEPGVSGQKARGLLGRVG